MCTYTERSGKTGISVKEIDIYELEDIARKQIRGGMKKAQQEDN